MSGAMIVDIVVIMVALGAMISGWRQGGLSAIFSLIGVLLGGYFSVTALPSVLDIAEEYGADSSGARFIVALALLTLGIVLGFALGSTLGQMMRNKIRTRQGLKAESAVGAVVQIITTLTVVWLILVPLVNARNSDFAQAIKGSRVLAGVEALAPDFLTKLPTQVGTFISSNGFPVITDPLDNLPQQEVQPPNPQLQSSPVVHNTRDAVVRVVGEAQQCRRLLQGSGFALAPDTVMTNAHVVAGTDRVKLDTTQGIVDAEVTYYNPLEDVALLKITSATRLPVLDWAAQPAVEGQSAIVLGFPQGGAFQAAPARIRQMFTVNGPDIYADKRVDREAYSLRASVVQGNSGGPLIDEAGHVLGLVFGADVNQEETGYALTKEEVLKDLGGKLEAVEPVDTGACVLH